MSANAKIKDWQGKSVWLIGASAGIGEALARDLSATGAKVVLSARGVERLNTLSAQLPNSSVVAFDFSDAAQTEAAWAQVKAVVGTPDLVIVNAGTYVAMPAKHFDVAGIRKQFDMNVMGPMNVTQQVLPALIAAGGGHISYVSSVAGYRGLPRAIAYGASKSALTYMAQCLHIELGHKGIGVSVICPGFVKTDLTAQNNFHMPALITPQQASAAIMKGYAKGEFEIHFPKRFTRFLKVLELLPYGMYEWIVRKTL